MQLPVAKLYRFDPHNNCAQVIIMKTGTKRVVQGKRVNWRMNAHGALKAFTKDRNKTAGMFC
jgi:hypothetical protein